VPVKRVDGRELDAMAHGASHGGVLALVLPKPRWNGDDLLDCLRRLTAPPLMILPEGVDDARNLGFTIRTRSGVVSPKKATRSMEPARWGISDSVR